MKYRGLNSLVKRLPAYADDVKKNIIEMFSSNLEGLATKEIYGIALTIGYFLKNEQMLNDIRSEAKYHLEEADATAAKCAVIYSSMFSSYYGFTSVIQEKEVSTLPANLHISHFRDKLVSEREFELYCFAISILLNCKCCMDEHIDKLHSYGASNECMHNVARMVAVLKAAKAALEIENMRSYDFIARDSIF